MTGAVTQLWRHPIKSHGREALERVTAVAGQALPFDRFWAVQHDHSKHDGEGWADCMNFMIGTRTPGLAGLWAKLDEGPRRVTLSHEKLGKLTFHPDDYLEASQFLAWIAPLIPENRAQPRRVVQAGTRGMTDTDYPSVSIMNESSHRAVSQKLGRPIETERWRGNVWFDGLAPWEEFDWLGKTIRVGGTVLQVQDRIERCLHTAANPKTGVRDADTLGALRSGWDHQDFGVYAQVIEGGDIAIGDKVELA
ncbi:MOSC domain-containing protein [Aestuariivita boseongensis]|uniref:MOSC domain-containing protein n=1 Tax=Aestuariivita boseongensis TaxID=1470562 RepID=UPI000682A7CB|nr:MOSC domain-containing protein [Aestuariivita boseongensis]